MPETAEQRSQRNRRAALIRWAHEDPTRTAKAGQRGLLAKFEREVDPDGKLPEKVRRARAERLLRVHMSKIRELRGTKKTPETGPDTAPGDA